MTRINPIDPAAASEEVRRRFETVKVGIGRVPNLIGTMAVAPAVLGAYLDYRATLATGTLGPRVTSEIGLAIAGATQSEYMVASQSFLAANITHLSPDTIAKALLGRPDEPRSAAAVGLALRILDTYGKVDDADIAVAREAGLGDGEVTEVVGVVAMNLLICFFSNVAELVIDYPATAIAAGAR